MYDDEVFGYNNSKTMTSTETESRVSASSETYVSPDMSSDFDDDYSIAPNYKEETNYDASVSSMEEGVEQEQKIFGRINAPVIARKKVEEEETVTLTKTKEVIRLTGRMKLVFSMFVIIMAALITAISWNFASASRINGSFESKLARINELQLSISELSSEYNKLSDDGYIKTQATNELGYVEADETNTIVISLGEMYARPNVQEVPSNWFNDVCDFFSKIFG